MYPLTRVSSSGGGADATRSMVDRGPVSVLGIDHVQVAAPPGCEAEARAFYGGLLGLEELPKPEALRARGGCWFRAGAQELHVGVEEPFAPARKAHPGLVVADLDALADRLRGCRRRRRAGRLDPGHDAVPCRRPVRQPAGAPRGLARTGRTEGRLCVSAHGGCHQAWLAAAGRRIAFCAGRNDGGHEFVTPA